LGCGLNGDDCPDEAHAETLDGCPWIALGWMKAHPAVSVGTPISAIAIIGLVVLYPKRRPNEMVSNIEKLQSQYFFKRLLMILHHRMKGRLIRPIKMATNGSIKLMVRSGID
jgi:hypothetical protein